MLTHSKKEKRPLVQAKLTIGPSNDAFEQEADQVAEKVVQRMATTPQDAPMQAKTSAPAIQPKAQDTPEEELIQREEDEQLAKPIMTASAGDDTPIQPKKKNDFSMSGNAGNFENQLSRSKGQGQAMAPDNRQKMETAFGADFGNVRIHTGANAAQMNQTIQAKAFTHGSDIYFNQSNYQPQSSEGQRLLAHELTHTIQQGATSKAKGTIQPYRERYEEADNDPLRSSYFTRTALFRSILQEPGVVLSNYSYSRAAGELQQALLALNYELPEFGTDYKFGDETEAALRTFQIEAGIDEASYGVLDARTLRALDNRLGAKSMVERAPANIIGNKGTTYRRYHIDISDMMTHAEFVTHALQQIFPISFREAEVLRTERGMHIEGYRAISADDLSVGHRTVHMANEMYQSVLNIGSSGHQYGTNYVQEEEVIEELQNDVLDLYGTDPIFELNKQIAELRGRIRSVRGASIRYSGITPDEKRRQIADLNRQIADLERQRDALLLARGMTMETFNATISSFTRYFGLYALKVARRMLEENYASAQVENTRYENPESLASVATIAKELATNYKEAAAAKSDGLQYEVDQLPFPRRDPEGIMVDTRWLSAEMKFNRHEYGKEGATRGGNQYFMDFWDKEEAAYNLTREHVDNHRILAHPNFHKLLRRNASTYVGMDDDDFATTINGQINEMTTDVLTNIQDTNQSLNADNVWKLEGVINRAKMEMNILPDTVHDRLITEEIERRKSAENVRNWGLAILGIGLGLLALMSGPVGWIALAGSIAVNVTDAVIQYNETTFQRAAHRTAMDPRYALTQIDRSWLWFGISLLGIGLDAFDVVKLVRASARSVDLAGESAEAIQRQLLETVDEAVENSARLGDEAVEGTARVGDEAVEGTARVGDEVGEAAEDLVLNNPGAARQGIESEEFLNRLRLLQQLEASGAMPRLANALQDDAVVNALLRLQREGLDDAFSFVTGVGSEWLSQLPRVLQVADAGNLARANRELYEALLVDPRIQRVLLDHADEPTILIEAWRRWREAQRLRSISSNFAEYLSRGLGYHTSIRAARTDQLLTDVFTAAFTTWTHLERNASLLRLSAPRLMTEFTNGTLPAHLQRALQELMDTNIIGRSTMRNQARSRVVRRVNEVLGESAQNVDDFKLITGLLDQGGSIGSVGEFFALSQRLLRGNAVVRKPRIIVEGVEGFDARRFIEPDQFRVVPPNRSVDVKVGYERTMIDEAQLDYYYQLMQRSQRGQSDVNSALVEAGLNPRVTQNPGILHGHDYLFLPSGVAGDARAAAANAFRRIQSKGYDDLMQVHFLDNNGVVQRFTANMLDTGF